MKFEIGNLVYDMHEAKFYKKLTAHGVVQCELCPRLCVLREGRVGNCRVRKNVKGELKSLVYGAPCAINVDPIEKKPLYHFLPGSQVYSLGTTGCNLHCQQCQNADMSQADFGKIPAFDLPPEKVVAEALAAKCPSIAYTYNEPTIFAEYVLDIAKLARAKKIKNIFVSSGFINQKPLEELCKYIDAANIDLKVFDDKIYRSLTGAWLEPILETIKTMKKKGVWVEITNLIIPKINDKPELIEKLVAWIKKNLGTETPLHFSAFFPTYKLAHMLPTPVETLKMAAQAARELGLKYVYIGNMPDDDGSTTKCPKCKKTLISREEFFGPIVKNNVVDGKCKFCKTAIAGVWK